MVEIGLSIAEFLKLRPVELAAMSRALYRKQEGFHWRDAAIMACIVNSGFSRPKEAVQPSDFMPEQFVRVQKTSKGRPKRSRRREVADGLRALLEGYRNQNPSSKG